MNEAATTTAPKASAAQSKADKAAKAGATTETAPRPVVEIRPDTFKLAEHERNSWVCVVPAGTQVEDLDLQPGPLALIASLLHKGDDIRAFTADDSAMFDLVCVQVVAGRALCRVVRSIPLPERPLDALSRVPDGFVIRPATAGDVQSGYLVVRVRDNVLLNSNHICETRESAIRYLLDHPTVRGDVPQSVFRAF